MSRGYPFWERKNEAIRYSDEERELSKAEKRVRNAIVILEKANNDAKTEIELRKAIVEALAILKL